MVRPKKSTHAAANRPADDAPGDAIGIASNAARVVKRRRGGGFYQTLEPHIHHLRSMDMHDEGTFHHRNDAVGYRPPDGFHLNRGELVRVIYEHALELGIDVRLGRTVTSFWETDEAAGVVVDGARIAGDCVVASNGVHSKARGFITGEDPTPHPSGYSVFRTYFESRDLALDPEANWVLDGTDGEDVARVFVKEHTLLVLYTGRRAKDVGIMLTHQVRASHPVLETTDSSTAGLSRSRRVLVGAGRPYGGSRMHQGLACPA